MACINIFKSIITGVLLFNLFGINAQYIKPYIEIPYIRCIPLIDGKISNDEWKNTNSISDFIVWTSDSYSDGQVKVYLGSDSINLYVCFLTSIKSKENFKRFLESKKSLDSHLWGRHHVGIKLSNSTDNIEFKGGPTLSLMDLKNGDISWNGHWEFNASINDSAWVAEFKIPLSNLEANTLFNENKYSLVLETCNPGENNNYWEGEIAFTTKKPVRVDFQWEEQKPLGNTVLVRLENLSPEKKKVQIDIEIQYYSGKPEYANQKGQGFNKYYKLRIKGKPITSCFSSFIKPGSNTFNLNYSLPYEGNCQLNLILKDVDGKLIHRSQRFLTGLACLSEVLDTISKKINDCNVLMNGSFKIFEPEFSQLQKTAIILKKLVKNQWKSQSWHSFKITVDSFDLKLSQFIHRVKYYKNTKSASLFGVTGTNSLEKIKRDSEFAGIMRNEYDLSAARNEYESMQLVLLPFGKDLNDVKVKVDDFIDDKGNKIFKENVEVSLVDYNQILIQPNYLNTYKGWYPDPLLPVINTFSISGNELCRPIWVTLYVPENTTPGKYKSKVIISTSNLGSIEYFINLNVWQFSLPMQPSLMTHTWDDIDLLKQFYNVEELPVDWYLNFCDLLLKNRLNPSFASINYIKKDSLGKYDFKITGQILEHCIKRGLTKFSLCQMKKGDYAPGSIEEDYCFIKEYAGFLKEKGWLNKAFVELWDEPTVLEWEQVKERASKIKSIDPNIKLQIFCSGGDPYKFWDSTAFNFYGLGELIDVWIHLNLIQYPEFQKKGKEIWSYFATLARSNAPNFYIDSKSLYHRMIPWYCWLSGINGFEHWSSTYFWRNTNSGGNMTEKWPYVEWDSRTFHDYNGEGQLVYPGLNGHFYPSLRLEVFRDGMEDYEYLKILQKLVLENKDRLDEDYLKTSNKLLDFNGSLFNLNLDLNHQALENSIAKPEDNEKFIIYRENIGNQIDIILKNR